MKRIALSVMIALPGVALAQQPGETVLQVSATGSVQRPADAVSETLSIAATGDTREAARAALDGKVAAVKQALTGMGIPAGGVSVTFDAMPMAAPPIVAPPIVAIPNGQGAPMPPAAAAIVTRRPARAAGTLIVTFANPALVAKVEEAISAQAGSVVGRPRYTLKDDTAARAAAGGAALTQARANADHYAAALKMRIVRLTRLSDYGQNLDVSQIGDLASVFDPTQRGAAEVTVRVRVWMDFAMAPL